MNERQSREIITLPNVRERGRETDQVLSDYQRDRRRERLLGREEDIS